MFLSALVSRYELDESLVVDLRELGGPILRYGSYSTGMPWRRWSGNGWVETAFDWGTRIVSRAHETRHDLPVLRYLQSWPPDLISAIHRVSYAQSSAMQICALYPAARDLAQTNLILLWLVAERYAEDAAWRARLPEILPLSQRELLAEVLEEPEMRPAQVRFLRKIVLMDGKQSTLHRIREVVSDKDTVLALRHWRRVPSSLLLLVAEPWIRNLNWLRDSLAATDNVWLLGQILDDRIGMLLDISRMLKQTEQYDPSFVHNFVARGCCDWKWVHRLHDALLENWAPLVASGFKTDLDPALRFGTPPLPSNDQFQALTTVGQLREEGLAMCHCVLTRAPDVVAGDCYIYKAQVRGERGTLQVGIGATGLAMDEFRLQHNDNPSAEAWAAARRWLETAIRSDGSAG